MKITINFDGACINKIATYGWLVQVDNKQVAYGYGEAGRGNGNATNNIAEYHALIKVLEAINDLGLSGYIEILGDSQLVVNQVNGEWRCNKPHLKELRDRVQSLLNGATLAWVPREENEQADELSKKAYQLARSQGPNPWHKRFKMAKGIVKNKELDKDDKTFD